jgi:hypothetical protein
VESGSFMAGQAVGLADEIKSVNDVIGELVSDAEEELQLIMKKL